MSGVLVALLFSDMNLWESNDVELMLPPLCISSGVEVGVWTLPCACSTCFGIFLVGAIPPTEQKITNKKVYLLPLRCTKNRKILSNKLKYIVNTTFLIYVLTCHSTELDLVI